jgi:ABC-type glycerol-3-phosphate transport system permease component
MKLREILVWIGIAIVALIVLIPILWGLRTSVADSYDLRLIPSPISLKSYQYIFQEGRFAMNLKNSTIVALGAVLLTVPTALLAGYALARFEFPGKRFSILLLVLPLLPAIAVLVPLIVYMRGIGLYNTLFAVVLANSVFNLPFATWMARGFLVAIPLEIEEAAFLDGCSRMGTLFRIAAPLSAPGLIAVGIFIIINSWNNYLFAFAFTTSPKFQVVPAAILGFIVSWGTDYAGLNATATLAMFPPLILFLLFQKWFIMGMLTGSGK